MELKWLLFTVLLTLTNNKISGFKHRYQSIRNECPPSEDIPKCTCKLSKAGLSVLCSGIGTDAELQSHLKRLEGYYLASLAIKNYKADSLPTTLLKGQEVEHLTLENVEVSDASFRRGQSHFQGLEKSLDTLIINKSFKNGRPLLNLKLDHLENLQFIVLEHNEIPEVGNDWFASGPKKLASLIFEGNGIEELGDQAFSSLNNLKLLAVAGNHINSISRKMLPNAAPHLSHLDLSYNKIRILPNDIFSGMPSLEEISLEHNLIHMIQKDTWGPVSSQLKTLRLGGNVLQCDKNMQWLCDTKLRYNSYGICSAPADRKNLNIQQFCKL